MGEPFHSMIYRSYKLEYCCHFAGLGKRSFKKNATFLRSFTFFIKGCGVLCVLLRSLWKNVAFFAFFYFLYKRMRRSLRSLRSFTFFIKEHSVPWKRFARKSCKNSLSNGLEVLYLYLTISYKSVSELADLKWAWKNNI